jgi:multisubunit Na+/H+ antiporter MnhB subunit
MLPTEDAVQIVGAGVIVLVALCLSIAWLPARRRYPGGYWARLFFTAGLATVIWDPTGVGVVGAVLAAMGVAVWWAGRPEPELPRPRRRGIVVASILTGLVALAVTFGWGALDRIPEELRGVATVVAAGVCVLGTLAIADRARVTFRDDLRRRLRATNPPQPTQADPALVDE